jgi:hypothetical protein
VPVGTRRNNTAQEAMAELLQQVAYIQSLPDADLDFLTTLQAMLVSKLREPAQQYLQMVAAKTGALPGAPAGGGPMVGPGLPTRQPLSVPPGLRNAVALPPVDELRRLVGQSFA